MNFIIIKDSNQIDENTFTFTRSELEDILQKAYNAGWQDYEKTFFEYKAPTIDVKPTWKDYITCNTNTDTAKQLSLEDFLR